LKGRLRKKKGVKQMNQELLMRPREVARLLGVSRSTVYRWYWENRLRGVRLDTGTIRILESAVREKLVKAG
jgi:excisionase family DNA binding protein